MVANIAISVAGAENPAGYAQVAYTAANTFRVDTLNSAVISVSTTAANGVYSAGAMIPLTVILSKPVTVTGLPQLEMETGATEEMANYVGGSGGTSLTFTYTVQSGDASQDLDYASTAALSLDGGTIQDADGNSANLALPAPGTAGSLGASASLVIGTTAAVNPAHNTCTSALGPDGSGSNFYAHASPPQTPLTFVPLYTLNGQVDLIGDVTGAGVPDLITAQGSMVYVFNPNGALHGSFNVSTSDNASVLPSLLADVNGDGVLDIGVGTSVPTYGSPLVIDFFSGSGTKLYALNAKNAYDSVEPVGWSQQHVIASGYGTFIYTSSGATTWSSIFSYSNAYWLSPSSIADINGNLEIAFSSAVAGDGGFETQAAVPVLSENGSYLSNYAPGNTLYSSSFFSPPLLGGPDQLLVLEGHWNGGSSGPSQVLYVNPQTGGVESTYPVGTTSSYSGWAFGNLLGDGNTEVAVTYGSTTLLLNHNLQLLVPPSSEPGTVVGAANLNGDGTAQILMADGSLLKILDTGLHVLSTINMGFQIGGVRVADLGGDGRNDLLVYNPATQQTVVLAPAPAVGSISSPIANGRYKAGTTVPVTVSFSEPVNVTGTPQLTLSDGAVANYTGGSGTMTLTFTYTVQPGDNSAGLDCAGTTALSLNGGTISDSLGYAAGLTLPAAGAAGSLSANKSIVIDTTPPAVNSVTPNLPLVADGDAGSGVFSLTVAFSKAMNTAIAPAITFPTAGKDPTAAPATLTFDSGAWTSSTTYVATYDVSDVHENLFDVNVQVAGARMPSATCKPPRQRQAISASA